LFYVPAWETSVDPRYGALLAIDPRTGEKTWEFRRESSPGAKGLTTFSSGALTTASGLVFSGVRVGGPLAESTFYALDAVTGDLLWQAPLPGASHGGVMTYAASGRQFVTITAGTTLVAFALRR
jgi:outer membrane protein assembly factor BamB